MVKKVYGIEALSPERACLHRSLLEECLAEELWSPENGANFCGC
jgi:hypothetical protein